MKPMRTVYFKDEGMLEKLEQIAQEKDRSLNYLLNEAIREYLERREDEENGNRN